MDNKSMNDHLFGALPSRAPLASAYVPMQESVEPNYPPQTAIARGTLFPGLDLPFRVMVNRPLQATSLASGISLVQLRFMACRTFLLSSFIHHSRQPAPLPSNAEEIILLSSSAIPRFGRLFPFWETILRPSSSILIS